MSTDLSFYEGLKPPPLPLLPLEGPRALTEWQWLALSRRFLSQAPEGDAHPVIVCPGFMASDYSTIPLRRFLIKKGYNAHGWGLGPNLGLKTTGNEGERLIEKVIELYRHTHRKVTLIGWSLGGVLSREIAKRLPDQIRQVITLGSPIAGKVSASTIGWLYQRLTGHKPGEEEFRELEENLIDPPEFVPSTSIYTKTDSIVAWKSCIEPPSEKTDNIEVYASHVGLGVNPFVFYAVADRLALPRDEWKPFDRSLSKWRRVAYPFSGHHKH